MFFAEQKLNSFEEDSKVARARIVPRQKFGFKKKDKKKGSVVASTKAAEVSIISRVAPQN